MKLLILFVAIAVCTGNPAIIYAGERDQSPTAGDRIYKSCQKYKKNILPDKLISLFLPRSLSSTSFVIYYFFFIAISVGRRISTYSSYITSLRKSTYFPESQLSVRREKFKICIINIYKQTSLFKTISQIKCFSLSYVLLHSPLFHSVFQSQKYIYNFLKRSRSTSSPLLP